ncbi:hypothetical protein G4G28_14000 [Massilia sp. Dwa41.01b]|uniref:hypothetical protein n=1 Tax=unclassified Massilia TaxID=2609279 RepID=UPI001600AA3A|nr:MULTISPECIES: hypothetical protein [unclassified Massilia]QNA89300.1 hypothetical protein G4G28_14000 [Massilia sp. Dwa41.01b]QNB00202.1 hypothetical protein G4G31_17580 [Massilia sp. Se16.2.3]
MGCYIEPKDQTKEEWLAARGRPITEAQAGQIKFFMAKELPVVLIDNGSFRAAGVAYDAYTYEEFCYPDGRHKQWFMVKTEDLKQVCALEKFC